MVSPEVKLVTASAGLYSSFLYWGYLQEKITGAYYVSPLDPSTTGRWDFSFVLNGELTYISDDDSTATRHARDERKTCKGSVSLARDVDTTNDA